MAFGTNMTGQQIIEESRRQMKRELHEAEAWRNTYQARIDKLRSRLGMEPDRCALPRVVVHETLDRETQAALRDFCASLPPAPTTGDTHD